MEQTTTKDLEFIGDEWRVIVRRGDAVYDLDPRLDLRNHSPTGFAWGYGGSGPAQLALAMLSEYFRADREVGDILALVLYQGFKWFAITPIPEPHFCWSRQHVTELLTNYFFNHREDLGNRLDAALRGRVNDVLIKMIERGVGEEPVDWDAAERDYLDAYRRRAAVLLEGISH